MKILLLCDHYPLSPRVEKIRNSILSLYPSFTVKVFAWNREDKSVTEDYVISYSQNIGYGNKFKKMFNLSRFVVNLKTYTINFNPDYIHAIDFEMLASSIFVNKNARNIYEIYDIKLTKNNFVNKIIRKIEFKIIKKYVDSVILASPFFENYYKENGLENINFVTLNNKPSKRFNININSGYMDKHREKLKDKLVIGFIGTIRYDEILINLISASVKFDNIIIVIAGYGPSYDYINKFIIENNLSYKVIITGRYESKDLNSIYESCDFIWATYPNNDLNVKYAISNKFFESVVFKKKIIVSESTMLGDYVNKLGIGFTVNPFNIGQIAALFTRLNEINRDYNEITFETGLFWEDEEKNLLEVYKPI